MSDHKFADNSRPIFISKSSAAFASRLFQSHYHAYLINIDLLRQVRSRLILCKIRPRKSKVSDVSYNIACSRSSNSSMVAHQEGRPKIEIFAGTIQKTTYAPFCFCQLYGISFGVRINDYAKGTVNKTAELINISLIFNIGYNSLNAQKSTCFRKCSGASRRTRTYNPSVNSRMLCH